MSNFEEFYSKYDELKKSYSSVNTFLFYLGFENPATVSARLNRYKRIGQLPPPSILQYFELVMDPVLVTNCMAEYMDTGDNQNNVDFDRIVMEYIDRYRDQETEIVRKKRKAKRQSYRDQIKEKCLTLVL